MTKEQIKEMIAGNVFPNVSGVEVIEDEEGNYLTRVTLTPSHKNPYGSAHGGLIYTMADAAAGFASCTVAEMPVTLHSDFHFIKNVKEGVITAKAEVLQKGGRIVLLRVRVTSDSDVLLGEGTFTYYEYGGRK